MSDATPANSAASSLPASDQTPTGRASEEPETLVDWLFRLRGWLIMVAFAVALVVAWPIRPDWRMALLGAPFVLAGAGIRVWSRAHFQRGSDTRHIRAHRLILGGPYRLCRNPLYVGNILGQAGLVVAFTSWIPGLVFAALAWLLYEGVIRSEEAVLLRSHGESYAEYRRQVPRWLPRPWRRVEPGNTTADFGHAFQKESQRLAGYLGALTTAFALGWWLS